MKPPPAPGLVNRVIVLTLLLLTFTGSLGLGAVWMRQEISRTANASRALEDDLTAIGRRLDEVEAQVAAAVNPDALRRQNDVMRLGLVSPREIQVQRVATSPERMLAARRNHEIFSLEPAAPAVPAFAAVTAAAVAPRAPAKSADSFRFVVASLQ
ncbi:MAG TPA: hypothetical protein VG734_18505 [Lacunisphaera sp.]|nr:hypothetical protein [Lacunisphaera sp.]